jgi:hypothetical protein
MLQKYIKDYNDLLKIQNGGKTNSLGSNLQDGGLFTTKSGLYAIFYKKDIFDEYMSKFPEDNDKYTKAISKKNFINVDDIRKMFTGHGFFYKSGATEIKSVVKPGKIMNALKKSIQNENGKKILQNALLKKAKDHSIKNKKDFNESSIMGDIEKIDFNKLLNSDKFKLREKMDIDSSDSVIIEKNNISSIKGKLQNLANKLYNSEVNIRPDTVVIIDISKFGSNKFIDEINLEKLGPDEKDKFSSSSYIDDQQIQTMVNNLGESNAKLIIADALKDDENEAKVGGFFQYTSDVDYNFYMGGGGVFNKLLVFAYWILETAIKIFMTIFTSLLCFASTGLSVYTVGLFGITDGLANFFCAMPKKIVSSIKKINKQYLDETNKQFREIGDDIGDAGKRVAKGVVRGAEFVGKTATDIGKDVVRSAEIVGKAAADVSRGVVRGAEIVGKAATDVSKGVVTGAKAVGKTVGTGLINLGEALS